MCTFSSRPVLKGASMVSNRKPRRPPTHAVTYNRAVSLNLYLSPSLQHQLKAGTSKERKKAQDSICIKFQRAGAAKFGQQWARRNLFIKWTSLSFSPFEVETRRALVVSTPQSTLLTTRQLVTHGECCDNDHCFMCSELNDHHRCTIGCTLRFEAA